MGAPFLKTIITEKSNGEAQRRSLKWQNTTNIGRNCRPRQRARRTAKSSSASSARISSPPCPPLFPSLSPVLS